jgi:hypothetical protein
VDWIHIETRLGNASPVPESSYSGLGGQRQRRKPNDICLDHRHRWIVPTLSCACCVLAGCGYWPAALVATVCRRRERTATDGSSSCIPFTCQASTATTMDRAQIRVFKEADQMRLEEEQVNVTRRKFGGVTPIIGAKCLCYLKIY